MKKILLLLPLLIAFSACNQYPKQTAGEESHLVLTQRPQNIILMVGDGMGLSQITAAMYLNNNYLHLEEFPIVGLHKAYAGNDLITDSAAGATAFAAGVKTYNGAIGVNMDSLPVKTILEEAEQRGMATGMVTTSTIVHATPAAFIAHVKQRRMFEEIAEFFLKTEIDLFIGGGKKYFDRRKKDNRNLYQDLQRRGYFVSDYFRQELDEIPIKFDKNFVYFTADSDPLPVRQGRDYLLAASKLAPIFLKNRSNNGFFLMIEGAQIDWGGHANDSDYIISEMLDFNRAIGAILDFAKEDGETLVIVTADHETGGYSINPGSTMDTIAAAFTTDYHTGTLVPVFAFGPGAELFGGIYENTAIHTKMRQALGLPETAAR